MGDSITYSEMNFTNKHTSRISSGSELREDAVTYAAVKNHAGEKKKKTKPDVSQKVSSQPDDSALTYASVNKPKTEAEKKNKKSAKTTEVSPQVEDNSIMYTAINKLNKSAQKDNAAKTQQGHSPVYKDAQMLHESTNRPERHSIIQDRRRVIYLICVLTGLCVILLITAIALGVSCRADRNSPDDSRANTDSSGRSLRCPDLWILINDKCYFISEDKKVSHLSDVDCTERGSRLAVVKEETIRRLVTITGKEFWVGLSKYTHLGGVWMGKWTDGSMENITEGIGNCAKLGSRLTVENCYSYLHWICERDAV